jgi:hypothetical protein
MAFKSSDLIYDGEAGALCCASRPHSQLAASWVSNPSDDRSADVLGCCTQFYSRMPLADEKQVA